MLNLNSFAGPLPPQFGARYKSDKKEGGLSRGESVSVGAGVVLSVASMATEPMLVPQALKVISPMVRFLLPVTALAGTGYALLPDGKKTGATEPGEKTFNKEESRKEIQAAITNIDEERAKQIHLRDQILHSYNEENQDLQELQASFKKVNEEIDVVLKEPDQTSEEHTRKLYLLNQNYRRLEKSIQEQTEFVDTLKKNADAARLLDLQHEQKMSKLRDEYTKILEKIGQIERSEKVAEMQKALHEMEGQNGATEKLEVMQDNIETRYHTALAGIQETLTEAKALEASMQSESALIQEKLKGRREERTQQGKTEGDTTTNSSAK